MNSENPIYTLEKIFQAAIAQNRAVAVWRLPLAAHAQACVALRQHTVVKEPALEQSEFGFLFCPFQVKSSEENIFIKADVFFDEAAKIATTAEDVSAADAKAFTDALESINPAAAWHTGNTSSQAAFQTELGFKAAVAKAVEAIQAEQMEKVVLSRNTQDELPTHFSPVALFRAMQQAYPNAFVSLVSVPGLGTWMGASPEILVSINQEQIFKTVALAGTQPAIENVADAIWRQKEIEEQGMVERYILSCFKALRLRDYSEVGPRTVVAANLMHLRTDFKVDLKEVDFPTLGTDMLHLLHPTSAVCGLPKAPALQFILENEGYNRSYYSGYLGPVNSPEGTYLFVNLRCMAINQNAVILYAGAGITGESNPEKEWLETEHKMQTMRQILKAFR